MKRMGSYLMNVSCIPVCAWVHQSLQENTPKVGNSYAHFTKKKKKRARSINSNAQGLSFVNDEARCLAATPSLLHSQANSEEALEAHPWLFSCWCFPWSKAQTLISGKGVHLLLFYQSGQSTRTEGPPSPSSAQGHV